jgi:hypothetical protein
MLRPQNRSERRLNKDIETASQRRQNLLDDDHLSLASGAGKLAIIVSSAPAFGSAHLGPKEQHKAFLEEAYNLRDTRAHLHQGVVVRPRAVLLDMKVDFADREITDIVLIGHGCINALWTEGGKSFDWRIASKATSYLKQGKIEQRMCGNLPANKLILDSGELIEELPHRYSVPLGTFAVSKLTNVIAAPGLVLPDVKPNEELFKPTFIADNDPIAQITIFNENFGNAPSIVV